MQTQSPDQATAKASVKTWVWVSALIVGVAICVRLVLNFRHPLAPGMDAAYYPLQTWWLLEHGELQLPAMPLIFWIDAYVAKAISWMTSMPEMDAARVACRLVDCFCQPWTAAAVMLLGHRWSNGRKTSMVICAAAAVFVVLSPPIMRMASDLQKNALGLVWMAFTIWSMREALAKPSSIWRWSIVLGLIVLAGVTHIGAFGATVVIVLGCLCCFLVAQQHFGMTRANIAYAAVAVLTLITIGLLICWLVPSQMRRLLTMANRIVSLRFSPPSVLLAILVYSVVGLILRKLWKSRQNIEACDIAIAGGCSLGLIVLFAPCFGGTWAMRFQLMATIPGTVLVLLAYTKLKWDRVDHWSRKILVGAVALMAIGSPLAVQGSMMTPRAAEELNELRSKIPNPKDTLVVAPHGTEFWAGLLLRTKVKQRSVPNDVSQYDKVLLVKPKHDARHRHPEPPRGPLDGRPRDRPPRIRPDGPSNHELVLPDGAAQISDGEFFTVFQYKP